MRRRFAALVCAAAGAAACSADLPQWDGGGWRVGSTPSSGADGVDRQGLITFVSERLPFPNTVTLASVNLHSAMVPANYELRVQPVRREIWLLLRSPLQSQITYQLDVAGLSDLDGDALPEPYHARFKTGSQLGTPASDPPVDVSSVLDLLNRRCAQSHCHSSGDAASRLDLSSAKGIDATARNLPSQVYDQGTSGGDIGRGTLYIASPLILDASDMRGSPERSYLIYKLLGDEHILGDPMPPPGETQLTRDEVQQLSDWIYAGAPTQ